MFIPFLFCIPSNKIPGASFTYKFMFNSMKPDLFVQKRIPYDLALNVDSALMHFRIPV